MLRPRLRPPLSPVSPSRGLLSRYIPDANRGVVLNLFAIPLNLIVISVFLFQKRLGLAGTLRSQYATGAPTPGARANILGGS
mgnify:CR=1 FL=1